MVCESAEGIISSLLHGWFDVEQCNAGHTYLKEPNQRMGERITSQGELIYANYILVLALYLENAPGHFLFHPQ